MFELEDQKTMFTGNNAKSLHVSFRDSLRKLRTDYVDLLYLHWWDWHTSIEEVMRALHALVIQGKVLYLVCPAFSSSDKSKCYSRVFRIHLRGLLPKPMRTHERTA